MTTHDHDVRRGSNRVARNMLSVALALAAAAALAQPAVDAAPAEYDIWYVGSMGDVPFQSLHLTKQRQADGTLRFTQHSRSLVNFLGQHQEVRDEFQVVTSPQLEPLSCRFESHGQSGDATAQGSVDGDEFVIRFERDGSKFERRFPLAGGLIFSPCLADALAARADKTDSGSFNLVDVGTWVSSEAEAAQQDTDGTIVRWRVRGAGSTGTWLLEADGTLAGAELARSYVLRRASAAEARQLEYLQPSDRDLLVFPVKRDLPFPERLRSLTVRLRWQDVPLDKLQLEDSRQRIVRQSHDGDNHEVVLELTQPAKIDAAPPLPASDPQLAAYLAPTHYIRPDDPSIRRQAQEWIAGATTSLEAAGRLSHAVWEYLEGSGTLAAETLSGPEVLACRKGKCSEFTTLLASLARSVGLPTRVALGMRLVSGRWMGHMWCEVWVGQWIPVDAGADEVGGSPALLKLTHSPTVQGTQAARWAIARSLEIEVLDVAADPAARGDLQTGIVRQTYTNADFACRITAPAADWKLEDKSTPGVATIRFLPPGDAKHKPLVHFVAFGLPAKIDPAVIVSGRRALYASQQKGFEVLADEPCEVGPLAGRRFVFRVTNPKDDAQKIKTIEIVWTHGRTGYLLNLIAEETAHDAALETFTALLGSFERLAAEADDKEPSGK